MKFFTRLFFLSVFCTSLFSCLQENEYSLVIASGNPEESSGQGEFANNFELGYNEADMAYAYVQTTIQPDGQTYRHHLVLTSTDVLDGDDLRSTSLVPTVTILLESLNASLVGEYRYGNGTMIDAGAALNYNVTRGAYLLRDETFDSGSTVSITADGDEFIISVDVLHNGNPFYSIRGDYSGKISTVEPLIQEVVSEEFSGVNFMKRDAELFDLTNAYIVSQGGYTQLYFSETPVHEATQLTGTSNVMLMLMASDSDGNLEAGVYRTSNVYGNEVGYFSTNTSQAFNETYFCRSMNFNTNTTGDDEGMQTGETLVRVDGDQFSIKFDYTSSRNGHFTGEFNGTILRATN
ncbi:MAG: hypothetical protein OTI34_06055 [Lewinella sp.]|nr:hypothetical protein [Lewinella sp.]